MLSSRVIMTAPWWQCKSKSFMLLLFLCVKLRNRLLATEAPLAVVSWHQFLGILDRKIGWTNTIADGWWSAQYFDGMISYSPINQDRIPISSHLFAREKNRSSRNSACSPRCWVKLFRACWTRLKARVGNWLTILEVAKGMICFFNSPFGRDWAKKVIWIASSRCEELYPEKLERVLIALHCYPEHGC